MKIFIIKSAGFCFGVKRAINEAEKSRAASADNIYTLGPIIHNPQAVKKLEESNIFSKDDIEEIEGGIVIIRSHGVRLDELRRAAEKGLDVIDATCPFVKKVQDLVSNLSADGYDVIVVGQKEHPEVKGLISYGNADIMVVESPEELRGMPMKKVGIVAQTTLPMSKLEAVVAYCLTRTSEMKVYNTICNATSIRQEESVELARRVDIMMVVGGRNSANTKRLVEICREMRPRTFHIEVALEIEPSWLDGAETIGITSGASTPNWVIQEVIEKIEEISSK